MAEAHHIEALKEVLRAAVSRFCRHDGRRWKIPILQTIDVLRDCNWQSVFFGGTLRSLLSHISQTVRTPGRAISISLSAHRPLTPSTNGSPPTFIARPGSEDCSFTELSGNSTFGLSIKHGHLSKMLHQDRLSRPSLRLPSSTSRQLLLNFGRAAAGLVQFSRETISSSLVFWIVCLKSTGLRIRFPNCAWCVLW